MSIDIQIKQKLFGRKTMPLEVILGEHLRYGHFVNDQLRVGGVGETEFLAYDPENIGRGFSVIWNPEERKTITLRLPQPCAPQELKEFYASIERMVHYWGGQLTVDGNRVRLSDFLKDYENMLAFNGKILQQFSRQVLDGQNDTLMLYSAMWPLTMGKEEAARFLENPDSFAAWLHEKQSVDAQFASPQFYAGDNGIIARFFLTAHMPAILPHKPTVPFGMADPHTGKPLECSDWRVVLGIAGEKEPVCEIEYASFLGRLPENRMAKYDGSRFLLAEFSEAEIRAFAAE